MKKKINRYMVELLGMALAAFYVTRGLYGVIMKM